MNKKNILIITAFVILLSLLTISMITLQNDRKDFRLFSNYMGYTLHVLSVKNFQNNQEQFDIAELVIGNEKGYCEAIEGFWAEDTRECLNVSEMHCRMITGSMKINNEIGKMGNCILK